MSVACVGKPSFSAFRLSPHLAQQSTVGRRGQAKQSPITSIISRHNVVEPASPCVCRIGFQFDQVVRRDGRQEIEDIGRSSSSLLIYQQVLAGDTPQYFFKCLKCLLDRNPDGAQQNYALWQQGCRDASASSWSDYLQSQVLHTHSNQFARECERNGDQYDTCLLPAVEHDLRVLQSIAISEELVIDWIEDGGTQASGQDLEWTGSSWAAAARAVAEAQSDSGLTSSIPNSLGYDPADRLSDDTMLGAPATATAIALHKKFLFPASSTGGRSWHESAEALAQYYVRYGSGLIGQHQHLRWHKGGFLPPFEGSFYTHDTGVDTLHAEECLETKMASKESLAAVGFPITERPPSFQTNSSSDRVVLIRDQRWQRWLGAFDMYRVVHLQLEDSKELMTVLKSIRKRQRCWFVVHLCNFDVTDRANKHTSYLLESLRGDMNGLDLPDHVVIVVSPPDNLEDCLD